MTPTVDLRVLELLAARLCHDLISPIAAISNGVELLDDEDPEFAADAVRLVGESARRVSRRLQFLRFAFGFTGSGLAGAPPHALVQELLADTPVSCDYGPALRQLPLPQQQLACNMIGVAVEGLPRGGTIVARPNSAGIIVEARGEGEGPSAEAWRALAMECPAAELTSRLVGAYFVAVLARSLGWHLTGTAGSGGFTLNAGPAP